MDSSDTPMEAAVERRLVQKNTSRGARRMPGLVYVILLVGLIACLVRFVQPPGFLAEGVMIGIAAGLAMYLTVIAGLFPGCWLRGIWRVTAICTVIAITIVISEGLRYFEWEEIYDRIADTSLSLFVLPLVIFAMTIPLLVMRVVFGWRLCTGEQMEHSKGPMGIDQLLLVITSLAAMLFMTKVAQTVWEVPASTFWISMLTMIGILAGLSFLSTVPALWCVFRYPRRLKGWLASVVAVALSILTVVVVMDWMEPSGIGAAEYIFMPSTGAMVFCVGLAVLRWSGWEISRYEKSLNVETIAPHAFDATDESGSLSRQASPKRVHLIWTGFTLLFAALSSVALAAYESHRLKRDGSISQLAIDLRADGGELLCQNRQPWRIAVGKSASDETVRQLAEHRELKQLVLAGSQITDATLEQLPNWFPELERLDLGHTNISAGGLQKIRELRKLRYLSLAGTRLSITEINQAITHRAQDVNVRLVIDQLDLSETEFSSDSIKELAAGVQYLEIRKMNYNDQDLAKICERLWLSLDISGNPLSGSGLNTQRIRHLIARDVALADKHLIGSSLDYLDVANTQLTDSVMPTFMGIQNLSVGDGQITDVGLGKCLGTGWMQTLALHGKNITGECLLSPTSPTFQLDLSGSGISDDMLSRLGASWKSRPAYINVLDLSDTNISDIGIQGLGDCNISQIDLSRTKVTARGLMDLNLSNCQAIHVDFNQFTAQELQSIRKRQSVVVGELVREMYHGR